ncbi:MAG: hypothetical protein F4087_10700 [Gemmatimonadetes bacterium]|nr:hypothetical protein [Gemmatimonadota bacterium]MYE70578.1 hypothetical protein [Gemmatimonadota bacterium]MYJ68963.1 hypothetical protein [Gemmatimonadota bacterium]
MRMPTTPAIPACLIAAFAFCAAACGADSDPPGADSAAQVMPQYQVRDSGGIRIIENDRPGEGSRLGWRIGPDPALTIGSVQGEDAWQFHLVDDALKLGDGRIVVANGGAHQLLVFDGEGDHLATWGQKGEGPGDFGGARGGDAYGTRLFWAEPWPGDSIAVCHGTYSLGLELLSVFDLEGRHARTVNLARDAANARCRDVLRNGSIIASRSLQEWSGYPPTGIHRYDMDFSLLAGDGSVLAELGSRPGAEEFYYLDESEFPPVSFWMHNPPFQQTVVWSAWGDLAIVSPTDRYEIRAYGTDGSVMRVVRRDQAARTPTEEDLEAFRTEYVAPVEDPELRELLNTVAAALPLPPAFPAFAAIEVDALGYLWVREYDPPGDDRPLWTVFDPEGIVQGFVETPPGLVIYEIGADYILGKVRDELRVEYVQLWPLDRSGVQAVAGSTPTNGSSRS